LPATLRQNQKAATRDRVVAAARELFVGAGYEAATVRQIASSAGVSVGTVFTHFPSKGDILSVVMQERLDGLYAELDQIPQLEASTVARLKAHFAACFRFECRHTKLFLAHVAASYDWTLGPDARPFGRTEGLRSRLKAYLRQGALQGDVRPDLDLKEMVDLLLGVYAWCYRLAAWEDAGPEAMIAAMDRQLDLIFAGLAPRG
jgi:AcrR family transcriptional regulator